MRRPLIFTSVLAGSLGLIVLAARAAEQEPKADFGLFIQHQLREHSEQLFGLRHPLRESAPGPYDGADNTQAIEVADGLTVSLVSSSVASATDQIALWPNDDHPTHLFVCDEETSNPAVQRVNLSAPPGSNATTIVTGLLSCDPVRRTPWGTIIVAEEHGADGGLYEILDPLAITTAINVTDRGAGTTSDSSHLVKRKAVGALSFESFGIRHDGTMIYGDELAPSGGNAGGALYKFVPTVPYFGNGQPPIKGRWVAVDTVPMGIVDANGNINLRAAQSLQKFTGYYRPEDMDVDPIAAANGAFRACWANTGRLNFGGGSTVENSAVHGEVLCIVEEPSATATTGSIPVVSRFVVGSQQAGMFDNVAFQPHTGNLVVLEDGPTSIVNESGQQERRGNDLWICLPDGADDDTLSDGCVRFASVRDTSAEPTGFIFLGSGEAAFVSIQHRGVNDAAGEANHGALLKISGFMVPVTD